MEFIFSLLIWLVLPVSSSDRGVVPGDWRSKRHDGKASRNAAPKPAWTTSCTWGSYRTGGKTAVEKVLCSVTVLIWLVFSAARCLPSLWGWFFLFFQNSEGTSPAQQQVALLDLQSALFYSQLEIQKLQRAVRQKERQLADAKRCVQFIEAAAHEREQQKEASWKHNQVNWQSFCGPRCWLCPDNNFLSVRFELNPLLSHWLNRRIQYVYCPHTVCQTLGCVLEITRVNITSSFLWSYLYLLWDSHINRIFV